MIKAVLDTNVIISALFWRGAPFKILEKAIKEDFLLLTSSSILKEVKEKLNSKFDVPKDKIEEYLKILLINSEIISPREFLEKLK